MLVWFLILCTEVASGTQCLPMQRTGSQAECNFIAAQYRTLAKHNGDVHARCIGLRR